MDFEVEDGIGDGNRTVKISRCSMRERQARGFFGSEQQETGQEIIGAG